MIVYHRPHSLAEAIAIRANQNVAVLAGGTDIYPARIGRLAWGDPTQRDILDITAIPGLAAIEHHADGFRLGCLVTWSRLARDTTLPPLFDGLKAAAKDVGGLQIQNRGTIIGNLCTASPAGDGIPNLLALEAQVEITGPKGGRSLPVADFLNGYRQTALAADEIATGLFIPHLAQARSAFHKLGARRYLVISIAMAAGIVALDAAGRITTARLALGACSAVAQRLPLLEAALLNVPVQAAAQIPEAAHLAMLTPLDDIRASAAYRREAALGLLRDLLQGFSA